LGEYVASARPGIAEAAWILHDAWLRGYSRASPHTPPPLQETLRTLGALLDEAGAEAALLAVASENAHLRTLEGPQPLQLGPQELRQEIAARTALRGRITPSDPMGAERYETRLRTVGAELDEQPEQVYRFLVSGHTVVIEGSAGYYRVCTPQALTPELFAAKAQRQERAPGE
jgi:hypothetical protein